MASLATLHFRKAFVDRQTFSTPARSLWPLLGIVIYALDKVVLRVQWPMESIFIWDDLMTFCHVLLLGTIWSGALLSMAGMYLYKKIDKLEKIPLKRIKLTIVEPKGMRNLRTPKVETGTVQQHLALQSIVATLLEDQIGKGSQSWIHRGVARDIHNAIVVGLREGVFGPGGSHSIDAFGGFNVKMRYNPVESGRVEYIMEFETSNDWSDDGIFFIRKLKELLSMTVGNLLRVTDGRLTKELWTDDQEESKDSIGGDRESSRGFRLPV